MKLLHLSLLAAAAGSLMTVAAVESDTALLPLGARAPSFEIPGPKGEKLAFNGTIAGKKAVILTFWAVN